MNPFKPITDKLAELLAEKRTQYGANNLTGTGEFFRLLYPNGIQPDQYQNALILARMYDKMSRIANGADQEDPWNDLAGYAVCAMELRERDALIPRGFKVRCKCDECLGVYDKERLPPYPGQP